MWFLVYYVRDGYGMYVMSYPASCILCYRGERDLGGRLSTTFTCESESEAPLVLERSDRSTSLCFSVCNDGEGVDDREETRRSAAPEGKSSSSSTDSSSTSGGVVKIAGRKNRTPWRGR